MSQNDSPTEEHSSDQAHSGSRGDRGRPHVPGWLRQLRDWENAPGWLLDLIAQDRDALSSIYLEGIPAGPAVEPPPLDTTSRLVEKQEQPAAEPPPFTVERRGDTNWLAGLRAEAQVPDASGQDQVPAWLHGIEEQALVVSPAEGADQPQAEVLAPFADRDLPEWLREIEEQGVPAWLRDADAPAPEQPPQPGPEETIEPGPATELPAVEGQALPDWMRAAQEPDAAELPAAPAEPQAAPEPAAKEPETEEALPDWLAGLEEPEAAELAAAPAAPEPAAELPEAEEAGLPDWLAGLEEPEAAGPVVAPAEPQATPEPAAKEPETEEALPDWLAGFEEVGQRARNRRGASRLAGWL